ncbi:hypothetical protein [Krasilnikovia sp. MM14-A1259]|uniref:hypothetical protein n=1 Tax=Krasilnikovia sp. MM14-A1259 TaxID=3373539 RepID=UPI003812337B
MSTVPFIQSMRPEPVRDQYGRYVLPDPKDGAPRSWTRATTIAHTLEDTHHLTQWKRRMVLQGAAAEPALLQGVGDLADELAQATDWRAAKKIKEQLDLLCDAAAEVAGAGDGASWGTLLHTITEYADAGRLNEIGDQIPDKLVEDLDAYLTVMDGAGIGRPADYIERILVNTGVDAAGTTDRILVMPTPCPGCGGTLKIGDLKTQKSVDMGWLSIAIQLAEYAYADAMVDTATGDLVPMPEELCRCLGIVMHLPVGKATCTLYQLDLVAGWEAARAAHTVRQFRDRSKAMGAPYTPPLAATGDRVLTLIRSANHPSALVALYRDLHPKGKWTPAHTAAAAARKAELLSA